MPSALSLKLLLTSQTVIREFEAKQLVVITLGDFRKESWILFLKALFVCGFFVLVSGQCNVKWLDDAKIRDT